MRLLVATATLVPNSEDFHGKRLLNPEPRHWLMYRRTYNGWGYSPLNRITRANVASLHPVWSFSTGSDRDHQSPPIVNDGRMFVTTPLNEGGVQVLALEAATGDLLWRYVRELPAEARMHRNKVNRGVALYGDKVYVGTPGAHVLALDAVTGALAWEQPVADPSARLLHHDGAADRGRKGHGRRVGRRVRNSWVRHRARRGDRSRGMEDAHRSRTRRAGQRHVVGRYVAPGRRTGVDYGDVRPGARPDVLGYRKPGPVDG